MNDLVYRIVIRLARVLFRLLGLRIELSGVAHVPTSGGVVLAANHSSFVDFMIAGLPAVERGRLVRFMAKQSVFGSAVGGPLMRGMGHIPVDRRHGAVAARRALSALQRGEVVGVYPEATIGHAFTVKERADIRRGAAYLAMATGAPLVPVAHWGLHRVWTVGGHLSLLRGTAIEVVVGEPLFAGPGETPDQLTDRLHAALATLVDGVVRRYPQRPDDPEHTWWWPAAHGGGAPGPEVASGLDGDAVRRADGVPGGLRAVTRATG